MNQSQVYLAVVTGAVVALVVNALFIAGLKRVLQISQADTTMALTRYREVAELALSQLTARVQKTETLHGEITQGQESIGATLDQIAHMIDDNLRRNVTSARFEDHMRGEINYLRRIAFTDNEYAKAVSNPDAQGSVSAQVRRDVEGPPQPGRAPVRGIRFRKEDDGGVEPRARPRTFVPLMTDDLTEDPALGSEIVGTRTNPWGAEPGKAPAPQNVGPDPTDYPETAGAMPAVPEA